jgi:hypothetical protein
LSDDSPFVPGDAIIIGTFDVSELQLHDSIPPFEGTESQVLSNYGTVTKAILAGETSRKAQPKRDPNIDRLERLIREQFCLPCEVTFSESQAKGK